MGVDIVLPIEEGEVPSLLLVCSFRASVSMKAYSVRCNKADCTVITAP